MIISLTYSLSLYLQAAIGSGGDGVYDTTRHGEPPKPVPNPEDPQYSHIEQEEKKKKEKKKDKKKNGDNTEVCSLSTLQKTSYSFFFNSLLKTLESMNTSVMVLDDHTYHLHLVLRSMGNWRHTPKTNRYV